MDQLWIDKKLDAAFLLESGLLFEINRTILHPIGISLAVKKDVEGSSTFGLKDERTNPEKLIYSKESYKTGHKKLIRFMKNYGHNQLKKRADKLGWSFQNMHIPEKKRHPND